MATETAERTESSNGKTDAKPKTQQQTEYVILRRDESGSWVMLKDTVQAPNRDAAVKKATDALDSGGVFKAVAASAWRGSLNVVKQQVLQTSFAEVTD